MSFVLSILYFPQASKKKDVPSTVPEPEALQVSPQEKSSWYPLDPVTLETCNCKGGRAEREAGAFSTGKG